METFSALLALCAGNSSVAGGFPSQRPVTRSFDVFFDLRLKTRLNEQSRGWWFETPSRPLWRHRNVWVQYACKYVSMYERTVLFPTVCNTLCDSVKSGRLRWPKSFLDNEFFHQYKISQLDKHQQRVDNDSFWHVGNYNLRSILSIYSESCDIKVIIIERLW